MQAGRLFERFFDGVAVAALVLDGAGRVRRVNPALCVLLQRREEALLGLTLEELLHPLDAAALRAEWPPAAGLQRRLRPLPGAPAALRLRVLGGDDELLLFSLAADSEQAARVDERLWIARELHDELGQLLSALRLGLGMARLQPAPAAALPGLVQLVDQGLGSLRGLIARLRPAVLQQGLPTALRRLAAEFSQYSGVACDCRVSATVKLDDDKALLLFRIAQEALTNVARHARARHAELVLRRQGRNLRLLVADDGIGFDPAAPTPSFGLKGMRERALLLGGRLCFHSGAGRGTRIELCLPSLEALFAEAKAA